MKLLEIVTRFEALVPRTMCWRPMRAVYIKHEHAFFLLLSIKPVIGRQGGVQ